MADEGHTKTGPQKAVAAFIVAAVALLANFGVIVPEEWQDMVTAVAVGLSPVLVYLIRNRGT